MHSSLQHAMLLVYSAIGWDDEALCRGTGEFGDAVEFMELLMEKISLDMKVSPQPV